MTDREHTSGGVPPADDLAPGRRLAEFVVESVAGRGAMGVVYRARQESLGRVVALKVIAGRIAADPSFRTRFTREARAAAGLDHPHIISVHGAGETDGVAWIAMQWVDGEDLREHLDEHGAMAQADAVRVVTQIADALDTAHRAGILHRDVKPANILVRQMGSGLHAYLTDFGVVRALSVAGTDAETISGELTVTGNVIGTPGFLAPEQVQGGELDGRADLYALACVLFEALTGERPLRRETPVATLLAHASAPRPLASEAAPALGTAYDAVLIRAMAIDPADRFPDGAAFARALAQVAPAMAPPLAGPDAPPGGDDDATLAEPGLAGESPAADATAVMGVPVRPAARAPRPAPATRTAVPSAAPPAVAGSPGGGAGAGGGRGALLAVCALLAIVLGGGAAWLLTREDASDGARVASTPSTSTTSSSPSTSTSGSTSGTTGATGATPSTATTGTTDGTTSTGPPTTTQAAGGPDPATEPARREVASAVRAYATAFTDHDSGRLRALFSPDVQRTGGNGVVSGCQTTTGRDAAIAIYERQFADVNEYRLLDATSARVSVDGERARIEARSQITTSERLPPQPISFVLRRTDGRWLITEIAAKCKA
ncbi:protein kinase [Paraconexibacter sp. AEG42_29]|uniref:protein kinase domain-containing protein n=1 Tax=Paraconexibacter sp. AEG42_29 TaxID=2997339 RepID=UPI00339D7D28